MHDHRSDRELSWISTLDTGLRHFIQRG